MTAKWPGWQTMREAGARRAVAEVLPGAGSARHGRLRRMDPGVERAPGA